MLEQSYRKILVVALPLMFGTLIQSIITITDAIFVSELGTTAIGAVNNGSLLYFSLFMFCRGLGDGTQITIAKKLGEGKKSEIGELLFNSQIMQVFLTSFIFILFFTLGQLIIESIAKSQDIASAMTEFVTYRSWGIFFAGLQVTTAGFFIGLGRTGIIMVSAGLLATVNIILDYGLIFGKLSFPELGLKGAPIASSISEVVAFVFLALYAAFAPGFREYAYSIKKRLRLDEIKALIILSWPLMIQGLLSISTWLFFFGLIEHMGPKNLETATNIRYMFFIAFIPIFGFASSTRTFVSNLIGQQKPELIPAIQKKIALLSFIFLLIMFHGTIFYPETLIRLVDKNPDMDPLVLQNSVDSLQLVFGAMLTMSVIIVPFHSVSALGRTKISFLIEVGAIITYLIGCWFIIIEWEWPVTKVWIVEYIYFLTLGILALLYLRYYRKKYVSFG